MTDHWVAMFPKYGGIWNTQQALNAAPDVKGVLRRIRWRELYVLNQIDLDDLKAYVAEIKKTGKKLSIMVEDKTFDGSRVMPDHMRNLEVRTKSNGYCAIRWNTTVRAEFTKLLTQIAKIDGVHSISLMETACGIDGTTLNQTHYSPELYSEMYTTLMRDLHAVRAGMPVFWYANFFPQDAPGEYIDRTVALVQSLGTLRLGGPDWWPTDGALMTRSYPRYAKWHDRGVQTFTMMSSPSYMQYVEGAFLSPKELLDGAVEMLKCTNVFWCFTRTPPAVGAYSFYDATHLMHP